MVGLGTLPALGIDHKALPAWVRAYQRGIYLANISVYVHPNQAEIFLE